MDKTTWCAIILGVIALFLLIGFLYSNYEMDKQDKLCKNLEMVEGHMITIYPPLKEFIKDLSNQTNKSYHLNFRDAESGGCPLNPETMECYEINCRIPILICDEERGCGVSNPEKNRVDMKGSLTFTYNVEEYSKWSLGKEKIW